MDNISGVGVLDKAVSVLAAVECGPATLAQLVAATSWARVAGPVSTAANTDTALSSTPTPLLSFIH